MPRPSIARGIEALLLVLVIAVLVHRAATPPAIVPATAPDTAFSAERAMRHVRAIARRPHPTGSTEHARVREYLVAELRALGLEVHEQEAVGIGTRYRMAGSVRNVVARRRGRAESGRAVLLASHYDSQGASPGAGDAASATAALLETARALRAGGPLSHDVILLLTDAEETGLLGAAAFVQQHPWASDVEVILNFEARGTGGRVFMFETAAGNLDVARVLRRVPDVSATSLMVMVYRILPNDTDLSELAALRRPAMNFAFIDGVERYHTAHDDVAHLDPRSVQHHGVQALALARAFGEGALPRPATGDAVFFDAPFAGLVVYPDGWAWALALLAAGLAAWAVLRTRRGAAHPLRDTAIGSIAVVFGLVAAATMAVALALLIVAMHARFGWGGAPEWRGVYAAAVVAVAAGAAGAAWMLARRWASAPGAQAGAIVTLAVLAFVTTFVARGASYVLAWPVAFSAGAVIIASAVRPGAVRIVIQWVGTAMVLVMLVPLIYLLGVALGIQLPGAAAAGLVTGLVTWLAAPHLERLVMPGAVGPAQAAPSRDPRRWLLPAAAAGIAIAATGAGALTVRPSAEYPVRASRAHQVNATRDAAALPRAEVLDDSVHGASRSVTIRLAAPESTWILRAMTTAPVLATSVAGRHAPTDGYRRAAPGAAPGWELGYVAPPDTGVVIRLTTTSGAPVRLELVAERAGLPDSLRRGRPRGAHEVPSGRGDVTVIRRSVTVP